MPLLPRAPGDEFNNSPECISHALFMHSLSGGFSLFLPFLLGIVSAGLTQWMRIITPGVQNSTPAEPRSDTTAMPSPASGENTAVPAAGIDLEAGEAPPAYDAAADLRPSEAVSPASTLTPVIVPPKPASSAHNFVLGTSILLLLLTTFFLLALSIQWLSFCQHFGPISMSTRVFSWAFFFCVPTFWATCGLSCWAMLVRNLWGPRMKEKWSFGEGALLLGIVVVLGVPFAMLGMGAVKLVEVAQGRWCAGALEEEVEIEELRRVEVSSEMDAGVDDNADATGSNAGIELEEHGESAGLIRGIEK